MDYMAATKQLRLEKQGIVKFNDKHRSSTGIFTEYSRNPQITFSFLHFSSDYTGYGAVFTQPRGILLILQQYFKLLTVFFSTNQK